MERGGLALPVGVTADAEEAHPAELRELGLVGVEHVVADVGELELEDPPLGLGLGDDVRVLGGLERGARSGSS